MSIKSEVTVELKVTLTLNESEARALDAIVGYGCNDFLKVFYQNMGEHYLKPHEAGARSLFFKVSEAVTPDIAKVNHARAILKGGK